MPFLQTWLGTYYYCSGATLKSQKTKRERYACGPVEPVAVLVPYTITREYKEYKFN